jgi:hypothetical protein
LFFFFRSAATSDTPHHLREIEREAAIGAGSLSLST